MDTEDVAMSDREYLRWLQGAALVAAALLICIAPNPARAYVEAPMSLGDIIRQSTNIAQMQVVKVDREKNLIIYKKLQDIKGKHPTDVIKHNIGRGGLRPGEWEEIMKWAEVGKQATFFHNGGASETYIGATWYQAYPQGEWWGMSHGEPFLMRSYAGKVEKLPHRTRRHARRQGSGRPVHGGWRQGSAAQEDRANPATQGEPQDPGL